MFKQPDSHRVMLITHVQKEGPFLKVWGQTDQQASSDIEHALDRASDSFENGMYVLSKQNLEVGLFCCAKYIDNKYYRVRVINVDSVSEGLVEVHFLDYGNTELIPCAHLRSPQCFNPSFISIPPLATASILAEVVCIGGEWNDDVVERISKEIRYSQVTFTVIAQAVRYFFIKILIGTIDLGDHLVSSGFMQRTSIQTQEAVLLAMIPRMPALPNNQTLLAYKAFNLEPNTPYPVYVSYVTDGPCHFSVQLKKYEDTLDQLMMDIERSPLKPLEELPLPGTICLAREVNLDVNQVCRAVVTTEVDGQYKIYYVDFGNTEIVPLENLYQIPFKHIIPKVMAVRLSLAGVEKATTTVEMFRAFKDFVDSRLLMMEVLPAEKKLSLPKCKLWDPESNTNVLDILNRAAMTTYPDPIVLSRGFTSIVKVSYVNSCNRFYVQLKNKEEELNHLMKNLQTYCASATSLEHVKIGQPCAALYFEDDFWYRSIIVGISEEKARVRYIDYGNEDEVDIGSLKTISGEYMTVIKPQAVECSLHGYQNMDEDVSRDTLLEALILEHEFTMKVLDTLNGKALVDLIDVDNNSVLRLLLEKIRDHLALTQTTSSPNKPENKNMFSRTHETSPSSGQEWKNKGNPNWKTKPEDNNWRQTNRNRNDSNSCDSDTKSSPGSWRQDNKGFRNRKDNEWNNDREKSRERPNAGSRERQDGFRSRNNPLNSYRERNATNNWDSRKDGNNEGNDLNTNYRGNKKYDEWEPKKFNDNNRETREFDNTRGFRSDRNDYNAERKSRGNRNEWGNNNESEWGSGNDRPFKKPFNKDKKDRFNDNWKNKDRNGPDYERKSYRKDDINSSGSEKSYDKGPRTSSRNDNRPRNKGTYNKGSQSFNNTIQDNSWNVSSVETEILDVASPDAQFRVPEVNGCEAKVAISWFHNPTNFYCQLVDDRELFRKLMEDIQHAYKDRKPSSCLEGSPVIGLFPEDNVLYRARILETIGNQYKVYYVDFGNVSVIDKVWPIENKFMEMPQQAICCSLKGICPVGDDWPNPDNFSQYFEIESLDCQFLQVNNDQHIVNLKSGGEDLTQQLINNGLVQYIPLPEVDIQLLVGQQFRALIKAINSLEDFTIVLHCGELLTCSANNLESATEKNEEKLKEYLQQLVIVYCDEVVNERLLVTLYDETGSKIEIVNPDDGAYETVDSLCPYLITSSTIQGYISHVNETSVVIQPIEQAENIISLLDQLFEVYENITLENPIVPEEESVYVVKSSDGNWYRARVTNFNDEKATVCFLDYGNSEEVMFTQLRELTPDFLRWDMMAVLIHVNVPTDKLLDKNAIVNVRYGELGWEGDVQIEETDLTEAATVTAEEITNEPKNDDQKLSVVEDSGIDSVQNDKGISVIISHVDSPNDFYIQLVDSQLAIDELQCKLQEKVEEMVSLENVSVGGLCAAPYSVDQMWYRSQILDADDDITTVRFIDYGNTDVIDNKTTKIKTLPAEFLSLKEYSTRCQLKIEPIESEWSQAALNRFEELTCVENIKVEFIDQDEKTNYVELYSNGNNVKDILLSENLTKVDNSIVEGKLTGFISHFNSPSEFWIQLENCVAELEWTVEQLSGAAEFPDVEDLTPGSLCAAMFPDDEMWYRARILSNTVAGLEVLFIDYGNSCICSNLKQLPEHLVMAQPLAEKCSLQKPEGLSGWTKEHSQKFSEISEDGRTVFVVKKISTGETSIVDLFVNDSKVSSMLLLPLNEKLIGEENLELNTENNDLDADNDEVLNPTEEKTIEVNDEGQEDKEIAVSNTETEVIEIDTYSFDKNDKQKINEENQNETSIAEKNNVPNKNDENLEEIINEKSIQEKNEFEKHIDDVEDTVIENALDEVSALNEEEYNKTDETHKEEIINITSDVKNCDKDSLHEEVECHSEECNELDNAQVEVKNEIIKKINEKIDGEICCISDEETVEKIAGPNEEIANMEDNESNAFYKKVELNEDDGSLPDEDAQVKINEADNKINIEEGIVEFTKGDESHIDEKSYVSKQEETLESDNTNDENKASISPESFAECDDKNQNNDEIIQNSEILTCTKIEDKQKKETSFDVSLVKTFSVPTVIEKSSPSNTRRLSHDEKIVPGSILQTVDDIQK